MSNPPPDSFPPDCSAGSALQQGAPSQLFAQKIIKTELANTVGRRGRAAAAR